MSKVYICANHGSPYLTSNIRSQPNTNSKTLGQLSGVGTNAEVINSQVLGSYIWTEYLFSDNTKGWIRNDVHDSVPLLDKVHIVTPHVPQDDIDSDQQLNDCGVAAALNWVRRCECNNKVKVENVATLLLRMSYFQLTSIAHIETTLKLFGIDYRYDLNMNLVEGIRELNRGKTFIALVNYQYIGPKKIPHFVTAIGYEGSDIIFNDPLNANNNRASMINFASAMGYTAETGNAPFRCIVEL